MSRKKKAKHNKKRNTALLYEALIRESTKNILNNNAKKQNFINSLLKEYFSFNTELAKELELYSTLDEAQNLSFYVAEKLIQETKREHQKSVDQKKLYIEQSKIISQINRNVSKDMFSNFVPNYKNLATIAQIFNDDTSVKTRVLLEQSLLNRMTNQDETADKDSVPISNLVYRTFIKKFNDTYGTSLIKEQKQLLQNYIISFNDNGIQLKMFLNEELGRLKESVHKSMFNKEISSDPNMATKTRSVVKLLENFKNKPFDKKDLIKILKVQELVKEIES